MPRALERVAIAALAAGAASAVAAGMSRGGSASLPVAHIHHGVYAFFDGTHVVCANPPLGGAVACRVDYAKPRLQPPTPVKYIIDMSTTNLVIRKFGRSGKILWSRNLR